MMSKESVLFIGTQFSNLYIAVDTPARGRVGPIRRKQTFQICAIPSGYPAPPHDSCNVCIVGVEKETSAMISDLAVAHLADSFQGLPDAHATVKHLIPKSKKGQGC
jgi:hypothetical protein